jgi:hypothetical protein
MSGLLKQCTSGIAAMVLILLAGCSQPATSPSVSAHSEAATEAAAPAQVVPAKTAFWPMYTAAHQWAPDVVVLRVTAKEVPGFKNEAGKAAMWEGAFGSPSRGKYRLFTWSIAEVLPAIHKGVAGGLEMPWGGVTRTAMPVDPSMFNVDSDAAFTSAAADAADWLKKNPGKPITALEIADTYKYPTPVWYVMWGNKQAGYAALVDASSGNVLKHK